MYVYIYIYIYIYTHTRATRSVIYTRARNTTEGTERGRRRGVLGRGLAAQVGVHGVAAVHL